MRERLAALDRALQYGPGMRAQRLVEALFLISAFFAADVRLVYPALAFSALQTLSPRLVPVAWIASAVMPRRDPRASDLYFDLGGVRGACAVSTAMMVAGVALVHAGHPGWGFVLLAAPTASLVLSPTVGFCCGCAFYVAGREALSRLGVVRRIPDGACDVVLGADAEEAADRP